MENKDKKKTNVTRGSLILRVIVSFYLLYTVYGLYGSIATSTGKDRIIIMTAMAVFTIVAIPLGGFSLHALSKGSYIQQKDETEENKEKTEEDTK